NTGQTARGTSPAIGQLPRRAGLASHAAPPRTVPGPSLGPASISPPAPRAVAGESGFVLRSWPSGKRLRAASPLPSPYCGSTPPFGPTPGRQPEKRPRRPAPAPAPAGTRPKLTAHAFAAVQRTPILRGDKESYEAARGLCDRRVARRRADRGVP